MPSQIMISPGRIVEGNVHTSSNIGMNGQIRAKPEYYFAVAISKNDPRIGEIFNAYKQEALGGYGNNQQILARINAGIIPGGFAWKWADGDAPERCERPGQAGCWVLKFKTTWDVKVVDQNNQLIDPKLLKTGFWCDVLASLKCNGKTDHTAGLHANPVFVRWLFPGYGDVIVGGPQPDKVMGAAPSQLPPGAMPSQQPAPGGYPQAQQQQQQPVGGYPQAQPVGGYPQAQPVGGYPQAQPVGGYPQAQPVGGYPQAQPVGGYPQAQPVGGYPQAQPVGQPMGNGTPQGWAQPANIVAPAAAQPAPGHQHQAAGYPNAQSATAYPSNPPQPQTAPGGPAYAQAAPGHAMPAGAAYMQAQPGSPTAYHSNPVHGFAHGNPQP